MQLRLLFADKLRNIAPSLSRILRTLSRFPLSWRKVLLTLCQVGVVEFILQDLTVQAREYPIIIPEFDSGPLRLHKIIPILEDIAISISQRSLLSMFIRTCPEEDEYRQSRKVAQETFVKEFVASQTRYRETAAWDWSPFYLESMPRDYDAPDWYHLLRHIRQGFVIRCNRLPTIYPSVSRKKNVGEETSCNARMFWPIEYVRTVDLEVIKAKTGIQIEGPCEMRKAWKFNDLKPRFYYCKGGTAHFKSRYMKPFAIALLQSCTSTSVYRRTDPLHYLSAEDQYFVIYWDYGAFTTSLSELKFYLAALAKGVEGEFDVRIFDYLEGELHVQVSDLLNDYNETINCGDLFSVHRLAEALDFGIDTTSLKSQMNNGMLGVEGNIGFSMAVHGGVIAGEVGDDGVCVGDDGIAITLDEPSVSLIPTLRTLGTIHDEKFGIIRPQNTGPGKFLKRGFVREAGQFFKAILLDFPISAFIDEEYMDRTVPPNLTDQTRLERVAIQIGQLLWKIHLFGQEILDEDLYVFKIALTTIYLQVGFPLEGSLMAFSIRGKPGLTVRRALPPIISNTFDPRDRDWLEVLMDFHQGPITIPLFAPVPERPRKIEQGESVWVDGRNKGFKALEDLGYVELEEQYETFQYVSEESRRKLRQMIGRLRMKSLRRICRMKCLVDIPTQYDFLFGPEFRYIDYMEIAREI